MRTMLRLAFAALVLLGLASQSIRAAPGTTDDAAATLLVERLARLGIQGRRLADGFVAGVAPHCPQLIIAALLPIDGAQDADLPRLPPDVFTLRYVFLGRVAAHPSRLLLAGRWAWAMLLHDLRLGVGPPLQRVAVVALPRACPSLVTADWSVLSPWD